MDYVFPAKFTNLAIGVGTGSYSKNSKERRRPRARPCLTRCQANGPVQTDHLAVEHVVFENMQGQLGIVLWRAEA